MARNYSITNSPPIVSSPSPSGQEARGDRRLEQALTLAVDNDFLIDPNDRRIIEQRISDAKEIKSRLESKSGLSKFLQARQYRAAVRDAYRFTKAASDRAQSPSRRGSVNTCSPNRADKFDQVIGLARRLYRCYLSYIDAFPTAELKREWVSAVWNEASVRAETSPGPLPQGELFSCSSMWHLTDLKMKIKPVVQSLYDFDPSMAPSSISGNATRAQALLNNVAFIYPELSVGGSPQHPYRHPSIQKAINAIWFKDKDDDGITFYEHFFPIPIPALAIILTVIECCINEWTSGTRRESLWDEERFKTVYRTHRKSLIEPSEMPLGGDELEEIRRALWETAL